MGLCFRAISWVLLLEFVLSHDPDHHNALRHNPTDQNALRHNLTVDDDPNLPSGRLQDCVVATGGTCYFLDCSASRGPTFCTTLGHKCVCRGGFCAKNGACVKDPRIPEHCKIDTGGTCRFFRCYTARGKTECSNFRCLCQVGYCSNDLGICVRDSSWTCNRDTNENCRFWQCSQAEEDPRKTPTCELGLCLCRKGYCVDRNGRCASNRSALEISPIEADDIVDMLAPPLVGRRFSYIIFALTVIASLSLLMTMTVRWRMWWHIHVNGGSDPGQQLLEGE